MMVAHRLGRIFFVLIGGLGLIFALMLLISAFPATAQQPGLPAVSHTSAPFEIGYTYSFTTYLPMISHDALVWNDEFDGSGAVDSAKWFCDTGTGYPGGPANWGTGEVETMSCSTNNVFQSDGYLHIQVWHTGANPLTKWTSGRIETARSDFQPSASGMMAVEARIRLPNFTDEAAQGYWPAFWMLGAPYRGNYWNWPGVGEIDIMENINGENQWWGALHCGFSPGGPCNETAGLSGSASGFSPSLQGDFHVYRMELDRQVSPQQIRWYVDGVQYHVVYADEIDETTWQNATNHGFFIILNVAIGGDWAGNPNTLTTWGGNMLVDYVRIYKYP